jgi:rare lipoprotein A
MGPAACVEYGLASWYRAAPHQRRMADGALYRPNAMIGAHRFLPFGTKVRVTNLDTDRSVTVRIDDRGPFVRGRIIDLSVAAARRLGMRQSGVAHVRLVAIPDGSAAVRTSVSFGPLPRCTPAIVSDHA